MMISLSVDVILSSNVNGSPNFTDLPPNVEIAPSRLKFTKSVLFAFTLRPMSM